MAASKNVLVAKKTLDLIQNSSKLLCAGVRRHHSVWTQDKIIQSPFKNIQIPNSTLYDYVWTNLDKWPERTATVCSVTGRGYTYEQAFKLSTTFAANLRTKFNMMDGDVAAIMMPNLPDFLLVSMGILEAGGVITTINPIYTAHEVQRQLLMSKAKIIITLPEILKVVKEALKIAKLDIPIIVVKTNGDPTPEKTFCFNEMSEDVHVDKSVLRKVRRNINDICFLPYSSGTTGLPKGVELTHRNIVANMEQINEEAIRFHTDTTATHQDSVLAVLPFFHIFAASVVMFHKLSVGAKIVTLPKMQPDHYFETLEKHKISLLFLAPPLVLLMGSHKASNEKSLQHLEMVCSGAAPLSASDVERVFERAKKKMDFRQGYGLTETSPTVSLTPKGWMENYSVTGPPVPSTEIRIVDENLKNLGPNEIGEILVRGPQVMRGYRDNPEANQATFTLDGWFRTGDLATADENGFITIADRLKELIKVKGYQVAPAELEAVLRQHPAVIDAAVIGVPHPTNGEEPKAFVVLKDSTINSKDVAEFLNEKVAPYKRVEDVKVLESIPKSASGKILRRVLKADFV